MLCIHGGIDKSLNIAGHAVPGHHKGAERVDRRLDQHIGNGEQASLQTGRQADTDNLPHASPVDAALAQVQLDRAAGTEKAQQHQRHADHLAGHRRDGHARNVHVEHDHQQQVQEHVHQPRDHQIAHRAHSRRAEIVQHVGRHAQEIDPDVQRRAVNHVRRRIHQLQKRPGHQKTEDPHADAHEQRQRHGGMLRPAHGFYIPGAVIPRNHHAGADAQAHEYVHQQIDQRACGGDRSQRFVACVVAHYDDVRRVIQQLQNPRKDQRP